MVALADQHPKEEVQCTPMRPAVTDRLAEINGEYTLAPAEEGSRA